MVPKRVRRTIRTLFFLGSSVLFAMFGLFLVVDLPKPFGPSGIIGWQWSVSGLLGGAAVGAVFAVGLVSVFRVGMGRVTRTHVAPPP
jgi:hypothetical protein